MKYYQKVLLFFSLCCGMLFLISIPTMAAASANITLDTDEIGVGEAAQLSINVQGASSVAQPQIIVPGGLSIQSAGNSRQFQIINGAFSSQLSYNYQVVPLKPGHYTLGPFEISTGKKKLRTNSLILTVTGSATGSSNNSTTNSTVQEREPVGNNQLSLVLNLPKTTLYQGEVIPLTLKLLVGGVSVDEVSYPDLNQSQFVFGKMDKPLKTQEIVNGIPYKVLEFHTTLTPVKTGTISLGPVPINCSVIVRNRDDDSFFGDFFPSYEKQSLQVKSKRLTLNILPIPETGRPTNFSGGIGQFQLKVTAAPLNVSQGDPVTVKMTISGKGNIQSINAPTLQNTEGLKVYDPQRKGITTQYENGGVVSFEQVLIPSDTKLKQIDPYHFSYFDPSKGTYQQLIAPAIPLSVKANPSFNETPIADSLDQGENLGRDLVFIKDSPGNLRLIVNRPYYHAWFWLLQLLPLFGLLGALYYRNYQKMLQSDTPTARTIRAGNRAKRELDKARLKLSNGQANDLLNDLHLIIRNFLAQKYNLSAAGMTDDVVDTLRNEKITETTLRQISDFFAKYDFYRFTGAHITKEDAQKIWDNVNQIIIDLNQKNNNNFNHKLWIGKEQGIHEND